MFDLPRRPRRLRQSEGVRDLVQEYAVTARDLIYPLFVFDGEGAPQEVESMPGIFRYSVDDVVAEAQRCADLGLRGIALFPCVEAELKDDFGTEALREDALIYRAIDALKVALPELLIFADVALDPYTTHGHDGVLTESGLQVANDETVEILQSMAVRMAYAGADFVAPSDMMDGRVGAIRQSLDDEGFESTGIMAYTAKYASAYYGPFRDAVGSKKRGDGISKATYQMDPANRREAVLEAFLDEGEGADIMMVKPIGAYLDILRDLRECTTLPLAAYQVSGEYAQIHAAAQRGWLDLQRTRDESLLAIKRAGADMIFTYFAKALLLEMSDQ